MYKKNEIIITNLDFQINNFEGSDIDFDVECYAQNPDENDQYGINIYEVTNGKRKIIDTFYVDSSGGITNEYNLSNISRYVYDTLFRLYEQKLIKGF